MQSDEVMWQVINHGHCSYKVKTQTANFCRNEYNVTGLCNRSSCPLANSRYATIREHEGRLYLYMKTVERAHTPNKLWQRIRLHRQYMKALEQIDKHLEYWPKLLVHKNKQRLTKITQYLIRMRRLALKPRPKLVTVPTRTETRERRREKKAEKAAQIEKAIEGELLERLKQGTYGDIYNFPLQDYEKMLEAAEKEMERQSQDVEHFVEGDEDEDEDDEQVEYLEEDEVEMDEDDMEDYDRMPSEEAVSSGDEGAESDEGQTSGSCEDMDDSNDEGLENGGEKSSALRRRGRQEAKRRPSGKGRLDSTTRQHKRRRGLEIEYEEEREAVPSHAHW